MIFASFFDGFPVVERARIYILGSLCIEMYNVGLPVCVLRDAPAANVYIYIYIYIYIYTALCKNSVKAI